MITLSLHEIPENDSLHFHGEADAIGLDLGEAGAEAVGPLVYDLFVGLSGSSLFATGSLSQRVKMTCVACLESFEYQVETKEFAMQRDLTISAHHERSGLVDLTEEVREDIHLLLPMHPRCDMGGHKKCSVSFLKSDSNLKNNSEHHLIEPASNERTSLWAALDHLTNI